MMLLFYKGQLQNVQRSIMCVDLLIKPFVW